MPLATDSDASASSSDELAAAAGPPPPPLSPPDRDIADALHAWLTAVSPTAPPTPFATSSVCVPLCTVFSQLAPHLLTPRDFFPLGAPTSPTFLRQLRYNVRRLARALAAWFDHVPAGDPAAAPRLAPTAADALALLADADRPTAADVRTALALAEALLCAAVHGATRDAYIKAVLALPSRQQDALALSIRRTTVDAAPQSPHRAPRTQGPTSGAPHPGAAARGPLTRSAENDENVARGAAAVAAATGMTSAASLALSPGGVAIASGGVVGAALSRASSFGENNSSSANTPDSRLAAPTGVSLADYKALASERDNLRRKLTASDAERARLHEVEDTLRKNIDDAADRMRDLASEKGRLEDTLAEKLNALADAQEGLRAAHVSAEEVDMLRAKATTVEQLEVSLKRASRRLEEHVALRKANQNLEAQLAAFRESESRTSKHVEYLEGQLASSSERAQKLADLNDTLSREVEDKEARVVSAETENAELRQKLGTAEKQLESMLLQSCGTKAQGTVTSSRSPEGESYVEAPGSSSESSPKSQADEADDESSPVAVMQETSQPVALSAAAQSSHSHAPHPLAHPQTVSEEQVKAMVTTMLRDAIGVTVAWDDIVECVAGVTDAMREMDEMAYLRVNAPNMEDPLAPPARVASGVAAQAAVARQRSRGSSMGTLARPSQTSLRSAESGSDAQSRISVVPEFSIFDSKLKAASTGQGDEFDFAANCINVREVQVGDPTEEESSSYDSEEDDEEDDEWEESHAEEHVDATVNATAAGAAMHGRNAVAPQLFARPSPSPTASTERKSPASEGCHSSSDPLPPGHIAHLRSGGAHTAPPSRSMTLTVMGGMSRSTSRSEAASVIARQTRNDLATLRQAMESMRVERQSSASVNALVGELDKARTEMGETQARLKQSEEECASLRRELNILLKEMDSQTHRASVERERNAQVLSEKERVVAVLQESVRVKDAAVERLDKEMSEARRRIDVLANEKKAAEQKVCAAGVIERAHEVEMAKLRAKLEANEELTLRLNRVVEQTDGLRSQLTRQHESQLHDVTESVRREKRIAEEARAEARRLAEANASVLQDVRATAQAAALARSPNGVEEQRAATRRSSRFGDFWRRLLLRERAPVDFTLPTSMSMSGGPAPSSGGGTHTSGTGAAVNGSLPRTTSGRRAMKMRSG